MNPTSGTFVTMDTYQGAINDPVSLHKYLYANANPVMNIDPSGNTVIIGEAIGRAIQTGLENIQRIHDEWAIHIYAIVISATAVGINYMNANSSKDYFGEGNMDNILSGLGDGTIGGCDVGMMGEASVVSALVAGMGITKASLSAIANMQMNNPMSEFYRGLAMIAVFNSLIEIELGDNFIFSGKERFFGKPGEVKRTGDFETKIGKDGRAEKERHNTDHNRPDKHSNPHDHDITWDENGDPIFSSPKNYPPNQAPEFK